MAERSVHEAAKAAMDAAMGRAFDGTTYSGLADAALAALVASAEVREGLRRAGANVPVSDWRPTPLVDAILAALAGTEVAG